MDQQVLADGAREGNHAAFTELAERYQAMALGYALTILGYYQLAQDATQEALFAAYRGIASLQDGARFPAWLRGIVRFQCSRVRRTRPSDLTALDDTWDMPAADLGPEQQLEVIDPLLSTSRLMDPARISQSHYDAARAVRTLLRRQRDLLEGAPDGKPHEYTAEERLLIARARKVQQFFSQPFAVATAFTGRPGQVVPLEQTIRGYEALLAGHYDSVPEEALLWLGALLPAQDLPQ